MPQSLAQVWLHLVFSTKERRPYLKDESFRDEMFRMLAFHIKESDCACGAVGGYIDHVHLLVGLSRTISISKLVESVKVETSKWAKKSEAGSDLFTWQAGYGAFSVSYSNLPQVERYIRDQIKHHSKMSYQDEFLLLCEKHGIEVDHRYVWD